MANAWMTHMKPYIAEEKKEAKAKGRKFSLKNAIKAAKKTYKKVAGPKKRSASTRRRASAK